MDEEKTSGTLEILQEERIEKNQRSFFDWLRGKEETDQERLRKTLNKELKEAARKRAEETEKQRAIEMSEAAETKKLKKKWRKKLLEKSKEQLEELRPDETEPLDGYRLAQYMVAEKIVELNQRIETEDLRRSEIKTIKIHIDFMGLLSEKLSAPELEMPEEVEEVYRTIIDVSAAEPVPEPALSPIQNTKETNKPDLPEIEEKNLEEKALYGTAIAGIIMALRRAIKQERSREERLEATTAVYGEPEEQTASYDHVPVPAEPTTPPIARLKETIKEIALPITAVREELRQTRAVERLAAAVAKADTLRAAGPPEHIAVPAIVALGAARQREDRERPPRLSSPPPERTATISETNSTPERPLEELSTGELLALATPVSIGAGSYLKSAFEKGEIDRDGLIKVLKAYQKGADYRTEFIRHSRFHQFSPEASPERPLSATPHPSEPPARTSVPDPDKLKKARESVPEPPAALTSPKALLREARRLGFTLKKTIQQRSTARWLLYASIAGVVVVFAVVLTLLTL